MSDEHDAGVAVVLEDCVDRETHLLLGRDWRGDAKGHWKDLQGDDARETSVGGMRSGQGGEEWDVRIKTDANTV